MSEALAIREMPPLGDDFQDIPTFHEVLVGLEASESASMQELFTQAEPLVRGFTGITGHEPLSQHLHMMKTGTGKRQPVSPEDFWNDFYDLKERYESSPDESTDRVALTRLRQQFIDTASVQINNGRLNLFGTTERAIGGERRAAYQDVVETIYMGLSSISDLPDMLDLSALPSVLNFRDESSHGLYVTAGKGTSWLTTEGISGQHEIVLSKTTAESFGKMFAEALQDAGLDRKQVEKALGYDCQELGLRYVYAHELGHLLAAVMSDGDNTKWEQLYLYNHPEDLTTPNLMDAIEAEEERFAESIAQLYLYTELVRSGLDDARIAGALIDYRAELKLEASKHLFDSLHARRGRTLGYESYDGHRVRAAALMGYGLPLSTAELVDRFAFVASDAYQHPDARQADKEILEYMTEDEWASYITDRGYDPQALNEHRSQIAENRRTRLRAREKRILWKDVRIGAGFCLALATASFAGLFAEDQLGGDQSNIDERSAAERLMDEGILRTAITERHNIGQNVVAELHTGTTAEEVADILQEITEEDVATALVSQPESTTEFSFTVSSQNTTVIMTESGEAPVDITEQLNHDAALDEAERLLRRYLIDAQAVAQYPVQDLLTYISFTPGDERGVSVYMFRLPSGSPTQP